MKLNNTQKNDEILNSINERNSPCFQTSVNYQLEILKMKLS